MKAKQTKLPAYGRRPGLSSRAFPGRATLAAMAAAGALAGCGGGGPPEETPAPDQEVIETVEGQLKENINMGGTAEDDPDRRDVPTVTTVECPDDLDLTEVGARFECALTGERRSGPSETGAVAVVVTDQGTYAYRGGFPDGVDEFGSGVTVESLAEDGDGSAPTPPEPLPGEPEPSD